MTERIFSDADFLSAFLWVGRENLLLQLYKSRLVLPQQVYGEMISVPQLKRKTDITLSQLVYGIPEADLYLKLTSNPDPGYKIIGKGEASAISLAKYNDGILGSNHLRDIRPIMSNAKKDLRNGSYKTSGLPDKNYPRFHSSSNLALRSGAG